MNVVLFVNHRKPECGVQQAGKKYYDIFRHSSHYQVHYIDIDAAEEYEHWARVLNPQAVIWNFYSGATMPWLSNERIEAHRNDWKQLCIYHELPLESKGFDLILHQDPSTLDTFPHWVLPRALPDYHRAVLSDPEIPTFGSFGFGLGGKGFNTVVQEVCKEYDEATIRLHIPFAAFGDADGAGARWWASEAQRNLTKPGVTLEVTHEFWSDTFLMDWLALNTCNCFFYGENYGRGISGTLDYALAVNRPLAITPSYQFKHVWGVDRECLITEHSLHEIIASGVGHLQTFHERWSPQALIAAFEGALESLGV